MDYKDYYNILSVPKTASQDEIKKAYRKLAVKYHPDKNQDNPQAEERFKEINEAYKVLGDVEKRKKYDELGANWEQYQNTGAGGGFDYSRFQGGSPGGGSFYFEGGFDDLFGNAGGGFSDFFNSFFGDYGSSQRGFRSQQRPIRGQDLQAEIEISLSEAYHGASRILNVNGQKIRVNIKPGSYEGQELRIKGMGEKGPGGGIQGDIYIKIKITPDKNYIKQGNDLIMKADVDLYTAVLGGKIEMETLDGKLNVTIPKGSQNGSKLRIKGKGMPIYEKPGVHGDLYIQLNVLIPRDLGQEETNLFRKLKELKSKREFSYN